jgi:hypothetical protein
MGKQLLDVSTMLAQRTFTAFWLFGAPECPGVELWTSYRPLNPI